MSADTRAPQEEFTAYFVSNYPGPNTIISDPLWHAPRIFRSAKYALHHDELVDALRDLEVWVRGDENSVDHIALQDRMMSAGVSCQQEAIDLLSGAARAALAKVQS